MKNFKISKISFYEIIRFRFMHIKRLTDLLQTDMVKVAASSPSDFFGDL